VQWIKLLITSVNKTKSYTTRNPKPVNARTLSVTFLDIEKLLKNDKNGFAHCIKMLFIVIKY